MGYWKSKVLPKIKKVFENKTALKKAAAAEAAKSFDDSKVEIDKEFEEKKTELQPKVLELYEAAPAEIKDLVKERTDAGVKKNSAAVANFLDELTKIEFPGAKKASEIAKSYGPAHAPAAPILFLLEKVSTFLPPASPKAEAEAAAVKKSSSNKDKKVAVPAADEDKEEEKATAEVAEEPAAETVAVAAAAEVIAKA